jgi:hypothetical protein
MRKQISRILFTGVTATAAVALSATTAFASTTYSVHPGGKFTGTAGKTVLKDNKTGAKLTCKSAGAKGKLKSGRHLSGKGIATITSTSFTKCTGPLGISFKVKQSGTWKLNVSKYKYTHSKGGVSTGYISDIKAILSGPSCSATVTGEADASYSNRTGDLSVKPVSKSGHVLKISKVSGCFGLINNGNTSGFTGTYKIKKKQTIR